MKMNTLVHGPLLLAAGMLLSWWSMPLVAQDAAATYKNKCSACHGPDGKGDTPAGNKLSVRDFASPEVQKQSDDELAATISDGKNKMPAYKKSLKPEQVKDLVALIRTFGKK
jgi:cytochrome c6